MFDGYSLFYIMKRIMRVNDCMTVLIYLMLQNGTLKNDYDGEFYALCILPQFFKRHSIKSSSVPKQLKSNFSKMIFMQKNFKKATNLFLNEFTIKMDSSITGLGQEQKSKQDSESCLREPQ